MTGPPEDYGDQQSETGATVQLDNEETLDGPIGEDPLDAGYIPNDRPLAIDDWGTTAAEMSQGEPLDLKLAQEEPDEPERDERRSGRLVGNDEGAGEDDSAQLIATDVGVDGGAASAEEAAVHVQATDEASGRVDDSFDPNDTEGGQTYAAGEGLDDEDMVDLVAEQTDSASTRAYDAGKDWDGQSAPPDPTASR
ncbi:MAG: DUF5709 domain-containing protein [Geodermatophilaceae bacterium]